MANEIYTFLKENNLTQKSEVDFIKEYSDPKKATELHKFLTENNLTQKDSAQFYDTYFKQDTKRNGIGVLKSTTQDLGFNSSMFKIPTFNQPTTTQPISVKKPIGTPTVEQQITGDYLIDNGQKGFIDKSVLGEGTTVEQPEIIQEQANQYAVDITDNSSDNTAVNSKGIMPVEKISAVNTLSTDELLNTDKDQIKQFLNTGKTAEQLEFEKQSESNNNIQAFGNEMSIYDAHIKALNSRSKQYESVLKSKFGEDFFTEISKQNTQIQQEAQQFGIYSTKRKSEYDRLVLELKDIEKQIVENQLPREQAEPMYNAKLAQIQAIESDIDGRREELIKKQDEINSKIEDGDFSTYLSINDKINQLTNDANSTISKPEFKEYRDLMDAGDREQLKKDAIKKEYQKKGFFGNVSDVLGGLSQLSPAVMIENLITGKSDETYTGTKVADEGDKLLGRTLKAIASVPKGLEKANIYGDENKYDVFDNMFDQAIEYSKKREILNPIATDVQRDITQKFAEVDGYKVLLDENGKPTGDVRDADFYKVNDKTQKDISDKYNENPTGYKADKDFSLNTLTTKATPTILDMGVMIATTALTGGSNVAMVGTAAAQMYGDMYESGLSAGLSPQEANDFATLTSIMTGMVTLVNPMEANIAKGLIGSNLKKFIATGISKADVQLIRSGEISLAQYAKEFVKTGVKNTLGENLEEIVLEPLVQRATETLYNQKAQKNGTGFEDLNQPFFNAKEVAETALITTMASLLMTPIEVATSVPQQRKIALQNALDNPQAFLEQRNNMLNGGDYSQEKFDYEVKAFEEISKQYNTIKPEIKEDLHDDLAELLLKKYTLKNTMSQVNDEVLNRKNQIVLDDINKRLEEVANGNYDKLKETAIDNIKNPPTLIDNDKVATYNGSEVDIIDDLADGMVLVNTNNPEIGNDGFIEVPKAELLDIKDKPQIQQASAVNIQAQDFADENIVNQNEQEIPITPNELIESGQEQNISTGLQQTPENDSTVQSGNEQVGQPDQEQVQIEEQQQELTDEVIPQEQPAQELSKEEKLSNDKHDRLVGLMREYNTTPKNKKTIKSELRQKMLKLSSDLGYSMKSDTGDKIVIKNQKGKKIQKKAIKQNDKRVTEEQLNKFNGIKQWLDWNGNMLDWHIDASALGLTWQELRAAKKSLDEGKITPTVRRVVNAIDEYSQMETLPRTRGTSKNIERGEWTKDDLLLDDVFGNNPVNGILINEIDATEFTLEEALQLSEYLSNFVGSDNILDLDKVKEDLSAFAFSKIEDYPNLPIDKIQKLVENAEQQQNRPDELQPRGQGEADGEADRVVDNQQEKIGQPTKRTEAEIKSDLKLKEAELKKLEEKQSKLNKQLEQNLKENQLDLLQGAKPQAMFDDKVEQQKNAEKIKDELEAKRKEVADLQNELDNINQVELDFQSTDKKFTPITESVFTKLLDKLKKAFPNVKVELFGKGNMESAKKALEKYGVDIVDMLSVWHGSPHNFDKFSTDKMGTGEGVQAFGWGLYFTDLESIAKGYAEKLAKAKYDAKSFGEENIGIANRAILNIESTGSVDNAIKFLKDLIEKNKNGDTSKTKEILDFIEKNKDKFTVSKNLYKVSLHKGKAPSEYDWLERDSPLSEKQKSKLLSTPEVKQLISDRQKTRDDLSKKFADKGIKKEFKASFKGEDIYKGLSKILGSDKAASLFLLENGIDGIKYPAESIARGATSDNARGFNYVVFDENAIKIEEKIQFLKTKDGTIYGFKTPDGKVFINTDNLNANTPIHEFGHIWQSVFPQGFARGVELLKLSPKGQALINEIRKNPAYKGKSLAEIQAEALVTAIGNKGEAIFNSNPTLFNKFKEWLSDFFKKLGDKLGIKDLSADDKLNMFTKKVTGELLGGKALSKNVGKTTSKTITFQGKDIKVKEINGGAEVVNGFYSPLEKIINETKFEKLPAKQWVDKFAKGEEAKWTGLTDWLNQQQGSVSKADIQQYLKDNRIQVVEVVKGSKYVPNYTIENEPPSKFGATRNDLLGALMAAENIDNPRFEQYLENKYGNGKELLAWLKENTTEKGTYLQEEDTKFGSYQLEGQKENYKEVLVTMPNNSKYQNELNRLSKKYNAEANYKSLRESEATDSELEFLRGLNTKNFKSSHFDEPNILVHLRMNTRVDADGNKVLFLEEVQSDWGQKGKKEGFKGEELDPANLTFKVTPDGTFNLYQLYDKSGNLVFELPASKSKGDNVFTKESLRQEFKGSQAIELMGKTTPSAPFVTDTNTWTKLGLKVALKEAVKQGADKIAWTTGEQQNERYDLSKQVQSIEVEKVEEVPNLFFVDINMLNETATYNLEVENGIVREGTYKGQRLEDVVGKDVAEKILNGGSQTLRGDNLKVGGKGMKGFYGSPTEGSLGIVGNVAKSLFKQEPKTVGIEGKKDFKNNERIKYLQHFVDELPQLEKTVSENKLPFTEQELDNSIEKGSITNESYKQGIKQLKKYEESVAKYNEYKERVDEYSKLKFGTTQHSIDITPEMKAMVEFGQPLFQIVSNPSKEEIGKAYDTAQKYLETTDFDFDADQRDAFIEEIKNNPTLKAMFTTSQLEKIYEAVPLSAVDKIKIKYKLLVYNLKANNSANKASLKQQHKQMVADITALVKDNLKGITGRQAERLINLATNAVEKNSTVRLGKIINQIANLSNQRTYQKAKTLYEVIKARSKRKTGTQSGKLTSLMQDFATLNPLDVSDIAKYTELAEKVKQVSNVVKQPNDANSDLVYDEVQAYVKAQQDEINSNSIEDLAEDDAMTFFTVLNEKTKAKFGDDKTFDDLNEQQQREVFESITKDDIKKYGLTQEERDMVEAFKEIKSEQKRQDFITATYNKIGELKDLLEQSVGIINQLPAEKEITDTILNAKLDDMTATEMARVLKLINGITQNNDYSGGGAFVAQQKAVEVLTKTKALSDKIGGFRNLTKRVSFVRNFQQIGVAMAKGKALGAQLMEATGVNEILRGIAKTKTYANDNLIAFKDQKFDDSVYEPISQMRQSIYAAVIQTKIGDDIKEAEHIARWKNIIESNIKNLRAKDESEFTEQADLLQKALDEVIGDRQQLKDIADNMAKIDSEGKRVVQFFIDNHAEQKPRFRVNSLLVHNEEIEEYNNYTKLSVISIDKEPMNKNGDDLLEIKTTKAISKKKSKSMIDRKSYEELGKDAGLDFNFINRQFKALSDNEYDINTSANIETAKLLFNKNNDSLKEILGSKNWKIFKNKLQFILSAQQYREPQVIDDIVNELAQTSRAIALGSVTQAIKQATVLISTVANAQSLDLTLFGLDKTKKENINKLLKLSEIGARRAEGAGGIYNTTNIDKKISDNVAQGIIKTIRRGKGKLTGISMYTLRATDVKVADVSWITYYKKYLKDNGLKFDDRFEHRNPNKDALAYAESMTQTTQGANTEAGQAQIWEDWKNTAKIFLPYMSFSLQAKVRLYDNVANVFAGKNKKEAGIDIGGFLVEQTAFNLIKYGISYFIVRGAIDLIKGALGFEDDDTELDRIRKAEQARESFYSNAVKDATYGTLPILDDQSQRLMNYLFKVATKTNVDMIPVYNNPRTDVFKSGTLGALWMQKENATNAWDIIKGNKTFGDYSYTKSVTKYRYKGEEYIIVHGNGYAKMGDFTKINGVPVSNGGYVNDKTAKKVTDEILKAFTETPRKFDVVEELRADETESKDRNLELELTDNQKAYAVFIFATNIASMAGLNETLINQINTGVQREMMKQTPKKQTIKK